MHRESAIDFHHTVAMVVALGVGTTTMAASNMMGKTDSLNCQNKDGVHIWKGESLCDVASNSKTSWRNGDSEHKMMQIKEPKRGAACFTQEDCI